MNDLNAFLESLDKNVTLTADQAENISRIRGFRADKTGERVQAAALMQPTNNAFLPGGVAYEQNEFIAETLLPSVLASPDGTLKASYFTFGKERLLNMSDEIGMYGEHRQADLGVTQADITLVEHGGSARISPLERSSYGAVGINIEDEKAKLIRTQVETRREALAATLLTTTSSYASASHYETLTGTNQWSHSSSDPLGAINTKIEALRAILGKRPNYGWVSPAGASALRLHPNIVKYVNGGAVKSNPAVPIGLDLIAAILGLRAMLSGEAIAATTVGGSTSDVWGDCAGLIYVGGTGMYDLKFGCTLISSGYPISRVERDPHLGSKGIDVLYYDDAYKHAVQLSTAGYLWSDVTA